MPDPKPHELEILKHITGNHERRFERPKPKLSSEQIENLRKEIVGAHCRDCELQVPGTTTLALIASRAQALELLEQSLALLAIGDSPPVMLMGKIAAFLKEQNQ